MAITYLLAPEPKWYIVNNAGTAAGGAYMYTTRTLNRVQDKIVYKDSGGKIPWTNPIIFDLNGVQGPFYWSVNDAALDDTYYIEVWTGDRDDPNAGAELLWTMDDFAPPGSGGGGDTETFLPLSNYIANNQFIDHIDDMAAADNVTNTVIAPSNHKGFTPALINPVIGTHGAVGPDIRFVKNNTMLLSDQITFPLFPLADGPLTGDVTPVDYVRYRCSGSPAGETYKAFQFPITQKVKNLSNTTVTLVIWAAVTSSPISVQAYYRQYFGSGTAASAEVYNAIGAPLSLTTTWTKFVRNVVIDSVAGKNIGTLGSQTDDDALYIQLQMPLGENCDILFIKPALYLGAINPDKEFEDYDQINSINSTPRTGDIKVNYLTSSVTPVIPGWVAMNDKSIGNVGSGATGRENKDTFQLYKTIWDGVINTWAPVSTGRGASAVADFIANKTLTLPRSLGRAMAGAGTGSGLTTRALGEYVSSTETTTLIGANLPVGTPFNTVNSASAIVDFGSNVFVPAQVGTGYTQGASTPFTNMQPSSFMNVYIKL